jgi:ABC-type transport system involved in cytochrome bd biosynthesis fused ATPase/permease subunit
MGNLKYYLPGSILILMALLIVALPEVLIALVAASMIMLGVVGLYIGHAARKSEKDWNVFDRRFFSDDLYGWHVVRAPVFRRWYRGF